MAQLGSSQRSQQSIGPIQLATLNYCLLRNGEDLTLSLSVVFSPLQM